MTTTHTRAGSRRGSVIALWAAFLAVHLIVIWLGWTLPNQPMGDVYNVYEPWSAQAFGGPVMGVTEEWVYPPLALWPMIAPRLLFFITGYTAQWGVFILLLNAAAFALLLGAGRSRARRGAAAFWTVFILLLGPVGLYRIDAVTAPLVIVALLWLMRVPQLASVVLAIATWIKIWPAAVLLAAFAVLQRRWQLVWPAAAFSAVLCLVVIAGGGGTHLFGFLTEQSDRGLQVEAPLALPYLWGALLHVPGTRVAYNAEIITFQVTGPGVAIVAKATLPLLMLAASALAVTGYRKTRAGVPTHALLPPLVLAMVLAFILTNKVGSPQFQTWLAAPMVLWLLWDRAGARRYAIAVLVCAALTQVVYPIVYDQIVAATPLGVIVLTARNLVVIGLFIAATKRLLALSPATVDVGAIALQGKRAIPGVIE